MIHRRETMQNARRNIPTRTLLKRFIPYYYKYKWLLLSDLLAASLTTVCELVLPLIVRRITNGALGTAGALTTALVLRLGALYILLRVVDAISWARRSKPICAMICSTICSSCLSAITTTPRSARS